jgi:hypothetical protein
MLMRHIRVYTRGRPTSARAASTSSAFAERRPLDTSLDSRKALYVQKYDNSPIRGISR